MIFGHSLVPRVLTRRLAPCLLAGLVAASCSRKPEGLAGQAPGAPVPVVVAQAQARDVPVEISAVGNVQAYSTVSVRPQVTGPITEVHFREGQEVKAGGLLFSIDSRPFDAALNQAQANLIRDEALMVNARLEFLRQSNLFQSKIAAQADSDSAGASYHEAQGTLMADRAAITNALVNLSYTSIRSPIDGRAGNLPVKAGNVVKAPDDVLVTINQIRPVYVAFAVPERQLAVIRKRAAQEVLPVIAYAPSDTNEIALGQLTFIDNMVDATTGTILLKGTFANTNEVLWPGQFVQASLTLSTLKQATVVPSQAIQMGQDGEYIFVVKPDSTVEARMNLVTGITVQGQTVITSGINPGETVVIDGQLKLRPGSKVSIKGRGAESASVSTNSTIDLP